MLHKRVLLLLCVMMFFIAFLLLFAHKGWIHGDKMKVLEKCADRWQGSVSDLPESGDVHFSFRGAQMQLRYTLRS